VCLLLFASYLKRFEESTAGDRFFCIKDLTFEGIFFENEFQRRGDEALRPHARIQVAKKDSRHVHIGPRHLANVRPCSHEAMEEHEG